MFETVMGSGTRAGQGTSAAPTAREDFERLVSGQHHDPHAVLGAHALPGGSPGEGAVVVRAWRPDAVGVTLVAGERRTQMRRVHPGGVFEATMSDLVAAGGYQFAVRFAADVEVTVEDPYRFWPTMGELDLYLHGEGRHEGLWRHLGAHVREHQGVTGTSFAVWAPNARSVRVVGDFNGWDGRLHPMRVLGGSGVWEVFIPGVGPGVRYKYELISLQGSLGLRSDPFAFAAEVPPATASVVEVSCYQWRDGRWLADRAGTDWLSAPMSIYECHLASWRQKLDDEGGGWRPLTYRELAQELPAYLAEMGFTHVQLMPVAEHPFGGSWGYQVTGYYAPTARFGSPDDFRYLVDTLHQAGIGVLVDWVIAHFPKDEWALARFDGTALYEHADPRLGEHPDWGTLIFNYSRNEVRNFLLANALYWIEEFHLDGLRVDAVASMLYLDYSRREGEWVTNRYGGRENLDAIELIQEINAVVYKHHPSVLLVAEESTAWPAVSRPTSLGGLGFGFKWNMGWMNDTLAYFALDPVHRRFHHHELTFALLYAFQENFVLPLSHDEVSHGKRSLLDKMPGERWQKFANLRALVAWMWAHPGRQLLFMGGEFGQSAEWSHDHSLDWHLLQHPEHAGMHRLVRTVNRVYRSRAALWERDFDWTGFDWLDADDAEHSVLSFVRHNADRSQHVVCVANLTPVVRHGYRIGLPAGGRWVEALNTDSPDFTGSGVSNAAVHAEPTPWQGQDHSATLALPPLAVLWLIPEGTG